MVDKRDQVHVCIPDLGLVESPMGSQGTTGQWDVPSPSGHSTANLDNYEFYRQHKCAHHVHFHIIFLSPEMIS